MICRIWRGWTTPDNADAYQTIVRDEVMPEIVSRGIGGLKHYDLMRRDAGDEVEFTTIMWFDDLDAVRAFVGEDYEAAHVPPKPRTVLKRWDERSAHYETFAREPVGSDV